VAGLTTADPLAWKMKSWHQDSIQGNMDSVNVVSNKTKTHYDVYLPRRYREDEAGYNKYLADKKVALNSTDNDLHMSMGCGDNQIYPYNCLIEDVFDAKSYNYVPRTVKSLWQSVLKYLDRGYFKNEIQSNKHNPYSIIDIYIEELIFYKNARLTIINELRSIIKKLRIKEEVPDSVVKSLERSYTMMLNRLDHRISNLEGAPKVMEFVDYTDIPENNEMGGLLRDERLNYKEDNVPYKENKDNFLLIEYFKNKGMKNNRLVHLCVLCLVIFYYVYINYY